MTDALDRGQGTPPPCQARALKERFCLALTASSQVQTVGPIGPLKYKGGELVVEALYMIVGSKEAVEYSISHIPLVYGVERVGVPSSDPSQSR